MTDHHKDLFFYTCINYHRVQCRSKAVSGSRLRSYIDNTWNMMQFYTLVSPSTKTRMSFFRQAVKVTSNIKLYWGGGGGGGGRKKDKKERLRNTLTSCFLGSHCNRIWDTILQQHGHWPMTKSHSDKPKVFNTETRGHKTLRRQPCTPPSDNKPNQKSHQPTNQPSVPSSYFFLVQTWQ